MDSTKIFLLIVGNLLNIILSLIFFYLIRIFFDIEIVGYYGTFLAFFTTFSLINHLGFTFAYLKFHAESKNSEEEALCNGTFLTYRLIQFASYIIIVLIFIPLIPIYDGDIIVVYVFFIAMLFFRASFFDTILLGKKEVFKNAISSIFLAFLKDLLLIVMIFYYSNTIWLLISIVLISNVGYFLLNILFIRKRKFKKPNKEFMKKFLYYSLPFFLTSSLLFIVSNIDVLLIKAWSDIGNVANYFTAKQSYSYFLIITNSITSILISTFSRNITEGKTKENIGIINYSHKILNLLIVPIVFLTAIYAGDLFVIIFGDEYRLSGPILFIFVLTLIPLSIDIGNTIQLQALGEVRFIAKFSVLENLFSIIFMILFIHPSIFNLDVFGGAMSYILAKILIQIIYRPILYKKFGLSFHWGSFRNLGIMCSIYFAHLWLRTVYSFSIYFIIILPIIDIILYFLINYIFRGFSKEDFKFLFSIINIKNIYEVISSEFKRDE
ncbi:MAG: lipopolysaccharide biosynthesis protein [Candidatus Hodarchaeota archaeon]